MAEAPITIADPSDVRVGRAAGAGADWIVVTYEFEYRLQACECRIILKPEAYMGQIVASLNALGFPQSDLEYIAARYERENS